MALIKISPDIKAYTYKNDDNFQFCHSGLCRNPGFIATNKSYLDINVITNHSWIPDLRCGSVRNDKSFLLAKYSTQSVFVNELVNIYKNGKGSVFKISDS